MTTHTLREQAYDLLDCLNRVAWERASIYARIPYSVRRIEDDTQLQRLYRIIGKAERRVFRRVHAHWAAMGM